jgi:hypothetical protein
MPAFGSNSITNAFAEKILSEPDKGFRLSDRIVSAIDRFIGALSRFIVPGQPGVMTRWLFIYPFVGGADWTHALNLADVAGNFEKYKITWSGSVTHNANGVTMGSGSQGNTNIDCADVTNFPEAWNRKSQGVYSRTNSAVNFRDVSAQFTEPRNGYTYWQGLHLRFADGNYYGDLCYYQKTGVTTTPNRVGPVAVADSLGLFVDSQRGSVLSPYHYLYKRGALVASESTPEVGMGYGDAGSGAWLYLTGSGRNYAFFFSTKHTRTLEGTVNVNGTGGQMPGTNADFYYFVQQLQVALLRAV